MFSNEVFLYEKSPLTGYPDRPIDKVLIQAFSTNHNDNVSIDDEVFFTTFTSKYTKAFQEISFGQCISIIINQDNTYSYNVNLKGSIKEQGSYIRLYTSPVVITFVYKKTLPSRL